MKGEELVLWDTVARMKTPEKGESRIHLKSIQEPVILQADKVIELTHFRRSLEVIGLMCFSLL